MEVYHREYYNFTIDDIEKLTDIRIERNKRNYQSQKNHLEVARAIRDVKMKQQNKVWWNEKGRPKGRPFRLQSMAACSGKNIKMPFPVALEARTGNGILMSLFRRTGLCDRRLLCGRPFLVPAAAAWSGSRR